MLLRHLTLPLLAPMFLLVTPTGPAAVEGPASIIVLQDGTRLRLESPPEIVGDEVRLRLYPSGLETSVALSSIDAEGTEEANRGPITPEDARGPAVTWGTAPAAPGPGPVDAAATEDAAEREALSERWSLEASRLTREREILREAQARLNEDYRRFEWDLKRNLWNPGFAGALASQLRKVEALRRSNQLRLETVEARLAAIHDRAARLGIPIRQVPAP